MSGMSRIRSKTGKIQVLYKSLNSAIRTVTCNSRPLCVDNFEWVRNKPSATSGTARPELSDVTLMSSWLHIRSLSLSHTCMCSCCFCFLTGWALPSACLPFLLLSDITASYRACALLPASPGEKRAFVVQHSWQTA